MIGARSAIALASTAALAACFDTPDYTDRSCTIDEPCPRGFVCGLDALCHPRNSIPLLDAGGDPPDPECDPNDPALEVPPEEGWLVTYHPIAIDGTIDKSRCFAKHVVTGDFLDFTAITSTAATNTSALAAVGRGRRTFDGVTLLDLAHEGGLRIRAGGFAIYDTFRIGGAESVAVREYLHGAQSVVFELVVAGANPYARMSWRNECDVIPEPTTEQWRVHYFRAGDGPEYALDRRDCLGGELINTVTLNATFNSSAPAIVRSLGITDRFGAEYFARRSFAAPTEVSVYYDDGIRIYVDDSLIFGSWTGSQSARTAFTVPAGDHVFRVEWFENLGLAGIQLTW